MTQFDWLVLAAVVMLLALWFGRYIYHAFNKKCSSSGCSNCSGCKQSDRYSSK
ncbi:FeoB-associated Cys-rich membrane protein [Amphritea japonica]|uniref:FeoB-associated Cys-rich membrane protein n=1 Tax=Amphritea japonica TaxID=452627 RepID=UPI0003A4E746|nr:FeoB-associated Cys-rich membrane protein [Amphritea japonica]